MTCNSQVERAINHFFFNIIKFFKIFSAHVTKLNLKSILTSTIINKPNKIKKIISVQERSFEIVSSDI